MPPKQLAKKKNIVPPSVWRQVNREHLADGSLTACFFDTKCGICYNFVRDCKPYLKHEVTDKQASDMRELMHKARGTKEESELLVKYFFGFSQAQLKAICFMIAMRSYQKADDLPDPSEIQEQPLMLTRMTVIALDIQ
ncbi:unnamed protein product [Oikopleura dioica]|uniref:Uncharacterized protein n=1 Tax=Oikopleura dioica TaxID=34765 RepID=E4YCN4_OIKDI|nr:unnamed protein product [Oikopleura dioica]